MGKNAIVRVFKKSEIISNIHVSSDGYLDGLGNTLLNVLNRKHVNRYTNDQTQYNRVGNFVALVVAKLVIESTESNNRVNDYFKKPRNEDLSCGGCEIVSNGYAENNSYDFRYTIEFNCENHDPQPPLITVESFGFKSEKLTVKDFAELINNGIPECDD